MSKKLAIVFPGAGYHCDKPLLYYAKKIAKNKDYEIIEANYDFREFVKNIKEDAEATQKALDFGFQRVSEQLKKVDFAGYEKIVFIGKSIGTAIAAKYNRENEIGAEQIVFTPIEASFSYLNPCDGFVFHGTADPLCDTDMCVQLCEQMSLTYAVIPDANHSLETGDVATDLKNMERIMSIVDSLM